jgi:hypothetical protein
VDADQADLNGKTAGYGNCNGEMLCELQQPVRPRGKNIIPSSNFGSF